MTEAEAHIAAIEPAARRAEAERLDTIFREVTGFKPKLWSGRMIGYGQYDYTYETGHSGKFLATGFAAAKRQISIYILPGYTAFPDITARLGKHRHGKSCFYFTRLDDADEAALRELIRAGLDDLATRWPITPT
ncbi:MAG: DUF1801 domain-containing protein [Rhodobacteraceae bacterium]|nr:DUF1801 domain-containing protein [Alphaproteobacteria bacterium]NNK66860.1 DUF1801 domain-containing protein [Paracoccaceae bacterium]